MPSPLLPVYPARYTIRALVRSCDGLTVDNVGSDGTPEVWTASVQTSTLGLAPGVMIGEETYSDTIVLGHEGGSVDDSKLKALLRRFARDTAAWLQFGGAEMTLVGVAALAPTALGDIEFDLNQNAHRTRFRSGPYFPRVQQLGHYDWSIDQTCVDPSPPSVVVTHVPCLEMHGPPATRISDTDFKLSKYLVCLTDGRLQQTYLGEDEFKDCGCGGGGQAGCWVICVAGCSPQQVPGVEITIRDGSGATIASGVTDATGCFTSSERTSGPYTVTASYRGQTAERTFAGCTNAIAFYWLQIRTLGCTSAPVPGVKVAVSGNSQTSDAGGNTYWLMNTPVINTLANPVSASDPPRFADFPGAGSMSNSGAGIYCFLISMTAAPGYHCVPCCNIPVCDTLAFTDSILGGLTLTYGAALPAALGAGDPAHPWRGSLTAAAPATCACPGGSALVGFEFDGCGSLIVHVQTCLCGGPCNGIEWLCPGAGAQDFVATQTLGGNGALACGPLDWTATTSIGGGCINAATPPAFLPCGCTNTHGWLVANVGLPPCIEVIWGPPGTTVTWTATDGC